MRITSLDTEGISRIGVGIRQTTTGAIHVEPALVARSRRQQDQRDWPAFAPFWLDPAPDLFPALPSRRSVVGERNSVDLPTAV